jgi:hypothetical protein
VQALFGELDSARERVETLEAIDRQLSAIADEASALAERDPTASVEEILAEHGQELRNWWDGAPAAALDLADLTDLTQRQAGEIRDAIAVRRETLAHQLEIERTATERHEAAIREQTHASPDESVRRDQREQARGRLETASELRDRYLETFAELDQALEERGRLLGELNAVIGRLTHARQQIASDLGSRLADIQQSGQRIAITVQPGGDRVTYQGYLDSKFLNPERGGQYRAQGIPARLAMIAPTNLVHAIIARTDSLLVSDGALSNNEAQRLLNAFAVFTDDQDAKVTRVNKELDELLELQEQPIEDLVRIESDGRPVDELSPGGRSSAMLPLIALSDTVPLIIDQPEDNLDNRMVGQTLSGILSTLKERRQIIVTTHNPNIVVGGDAEQVVVLDAPSARSAQVELAGSIDDPAIIDAVIKIMEGGREAFQERSRRYQDRLE